MKAMGLCALTPPLKTSWPAAQETAAVTVWPGVMLVALPWTTWYPLTPAAEAALALASRTAAVTAAASRPARGRRRRLPLKIMFFPSVAGRFDSSYGARLRLREGAASHRTLRRA
jgi:hypothetical protein